MERISSETDGPPHTSSGPLPVGGGAAPDGGAPHGHDGGEGADGGRGVVDGLVDVPLEVGDEAVDVVEVSLAEAEALGVDADVLVVGIRAPDVGQDEAPRVLVGDAEAVDYPHRVLRLLRPQQVVHLRLGPLPELPVRQQAPHVGHQRVNVAIHHLQGFRGSAKESTISAEHDDDETGSGNDRASPRVGLS